MRKPSERRSDYVLGDPGLTAYDHGVGTLRVDGELRGYLASYLGGELPNDPRPWFVVVWTDGTKEKPFGDHAPAWSTVRELDAGYFDHVEQGSTVEGRFLGFRSVRSMPGPPCRYEFAWLPVVEAAAKWEQLGLVDEDF